MRKNLRTAYHSIGGAVCAGAFILLAICTQAQNLFVADTGRILEFTPGGIQSTFVTGLDGPIGLAFDSAGDLFEADSHSGNIYEFTNYNGTLSTNLTLFVSGLDNPCGLAFDSKGDLFEADNGSGKAYEFTNYNGTLSTNSTVIASGLSAPQGLACNSAGNLFVAGIGNGTIYEITPGGTPGTFAAVGGAPAGLAISSAGDVLDTANGSVNEYTPEGMQSPGPFGSETFSHPWGLAFDVLGDLFVGSSGAHPSITEITPKGVESTFITGVNNPQGLAFPPVPELQGVATNSGFQLNISLPPAYYYSTIVQASTDLVNWTNICTNTPPFTFADPMATNFPCRYYRAVLGQ